MLHGSHEWGGKGLGSCKMKHEKWFGCFMVPWFPRVGWDRFRKAQYEARKELGTSWFPRVGWKGFWKAQNEA